MTQGFLKVLIELLLTLTVCTLAGISFGLWQDSISAGAFMSFFSLALTAK